MKLTNPLSYPIAVLAGGISLIVGVRLLQLPSVIILPLAAGIAGVGASYLRSREPESFNLKNPELERELQAVKTSALGLLNQANELKLEAKRLLTDAFHVELLAAIEISCERAVQIPAKIDNLGQGLQESNALLSVSELKQQLAQVEQKLPFSSGVAKQNLNQLAASLQRNIKLAKEGQDIRLAQIVSLCTQIQDYAGVLQRLQTQLHTADLTDSEQINQLQLLSEEMVSFQQNVYFLVQK
ncbi:hypothetical protein [Umezakia ovalisporum]|jgi:hypothetical protein|uniref:All4402 protein n=2 Tax=Umezakia ovalisporum TaxID=75695 RepID=A0AA43GVY6_9CYAN|nr:hypothetical protein [Umezakia ovalisporum]MBI1242913.1 hypothetical protein [Nostoc sp. RI_552]MDH6056761.1 hypothetical protein [Umezakia ovalisporum FSS-43]MDH6062692.1 hypothetical protein [Umezakia ovalisporum FSS-62]MDH6066081.1 hypothetical protein [Umezakia ovalisporum APH033B]MDH6072176.1 hypothetical protein [Umezakia ovalisporum CobakiLakeA]